MHSMNTTICCDRANDYFIVAVEIAIPIIVMLQYTNTVYTVIIL